MHPAQNSKVVLLHLNIHNYYCTLYIRHLFNNLKHHCFISDVIIVSSSIHACCIFHTHTQKNKQKCSRRLWIFHDCEKYENQNMRIASMTVNRHIVVRRPANETSICSSNRRSTAKLPNFVAEETTFCLYVGKSAKFCF